MDFTCTGEGSYRGSVDRWCEWTAPPAELVPGTTIPFVAECTVQQRDEVLRLISVSVSISVWADSAPDPEFQWDPPRTVQLDFVRADLPPRWEGPASNRVKGTFEVPTGQSGHTLALVFALAENGVTSRTETRVAYVYTFGEPFPPTPVPLPSPSPTPWSPPLSSVVEPPQDSGVRFTGLHGEVLIRLPLGYDANGNPIYPDEDAWEQADLETIIPFGAQIKVGHSSVAIVGFPDLSTLELRPLS